CRVRVVRTVSGWTGEAVDLILHEHSAVERRRVRDLPHARGFVAEAAAGRFGSAVVGDQPGLNLVAGVDAVLTALEAATHPSAAANLLVRRRARAIGRHGVANAVGTTVGGGADGHHVLAVIKVQTAILGRSMLVLVVGGEGDVG